tara:strand:- start:832 stop:1017 length:186 start_codon:yes stop_codon:yes gene_type:complete
MAKEKMEVSLKEAATTEMETLVEQHNTLVKNIQEGQARLTEVKEMLIAKQGYLKALEDVEK